jgi:predicted nucleic acid-binding protein
MIVVADTGLLNYLILIGQIDILQTLYAEVVIPPAVQDEMLHPSAPPAVRAWITNPPFWLEVRIPGRIDTEVSLALDDGEREAIALLRNLSGPSLLLIDENSGRAEATRLGIEVIGTLGIILVAHRRGLLQLTESIALLRQTSFKGTDALYQYFLDRV